MDTNRVNQTGAGQESAPVSLYRSATTSRLILAAAIVALTLALALAVLVRAFASPSIKDPDYVRPNMRYTCDDFTSQDEAQQLFDQWKDEYPELLRLDGDDNGIACQDLPTLENLPAVAERANLLERRRR